MNIFDLIYSDKAKELKQQILLGIDIEKKDFFGHTPLLIAAAEGKYECLKILLEAGADPTITDRYGTSPLLWAIYENHDKCAELLKKHK